MKESVINSKLLNKIEIRDLSVSKIYFFFDREEKSFENYSILQF